ncbi:MAG: aldehyde dehydrogenase family protein [Planctomycetota bacterium]
MQIEAVNYVGKDRRAIGSDPRDAGAIVSTNPAKPDEIVWSGNPSVEDVQSAIDAARQAQHAWNRAGIEERERVLRVYQELANADAEEMGKLIMREVGKAAWDSLGEAKALGAKVDITLSHGVGAGRERVQSFEVGVTETRRGVARFRAHGVMAVLGPFNFPAHLPNGHMVPALLMGNTVVLKPSDKAPAVGQRLANLFRQALEQCGHNPAIVSLVHGGVDVAKALVTNNGIEGVLFTGSWAAGRAILEANLNSPGKIIALEMGGNSPSVVMNDADLKAAAIEVARSAFVTTGQRCTCTRRLIVQRDVADEMLERVAKIARGLRVGDPEGEAGEAVFMGPLVTEDSAQAVIETQAKYAASGAEILVESQRLDRAGHYVTPGVMRVERFSQGEDGCGADIETFGPLLRATVVDSLDEAIEQANATRYGLASAIFTQDTELQERFLTESRAGCVNVNTGTAGASGKLPFGGLGISGNHRPAGSFSLDYCAMPVASLIETDASVAGVLPGMNVSND